MKPKMQHYDRKRHPPAFLRRLWLHPSRIAALLCLILIILFIRYQKPSLTGPYVPHRQSDASSTHKPDSGSRIAIVSFTTELKSYTHLSLKNHFRKSSFTPVCDMRWRLIQKTRLC